jgi:preprotein translocase subunit SecB
MAVREGFALKRLRLVDCRFSSPRTFPGSTDRRFNISDATIDSEIDEKARTCIVRIGIEVAAHAKDVEAFTLTASIEGLFEGSQAGLPLEQFAQVNAPAILFPYLRETVSNLTARSGHPALLLPTVNFVELARVVGDEKPPGAAVGPGRAGGARPRRS